MVILCAFVSAQLYQHEVESYCTNRDHAIGKLALQTRHIPLYNLVVLRYFHFFKTFQKSCIEVTFF